ncbi:LysR family transcriptional regulator [Paraburkholderia ultramafica]|uniref:LysR family transcriptional regulator n=1 Tax=Paraburkholderia ultramafica TaxID=1544867 RepID=UPI001582FB09|nr:LysR family transcriptional regulator [Paraburkholderia ultramafica]
MLPTHIGYFVAVEEQHKVTRASAVLHVSQPTLPQQISQPEDTPGAQSFDRSGRTRRGVLRSGCIRSSIEWSKRS